MSAVISETEESVIGQPFDSVRDYVNALDARGPSAADRVHGPGSI